MPARNFRWELTFPDGHTKQRSGEFLSDVIKPNEAPIEVHFWEGIHRTPVAKTALDREITANRRHK